MKKIIIGLVCLFASINLSAQNKEPEALYFKLTNSSGTVSQQLTIDSVPQTAFTLGWQWFGHPRMTRSLLMNCSSAWYPNTYWEPQTGSLPQNNAGNNYQINYMWQEYDWNTTPTSIPYIAAHSFSYKPSLIVNPNYFVPDNSDSQKSIWGFQNNYVSIKKQNNGIVLDTNVNMVVLNKPWRCDQFFDFAESTSQASFH